VEGAGRQLTALENLPATFTLSTLITDGTTEDVRQLDPLEMLGFVGTAQEVDGEIFLMDSWIPERGWRIASDATSWSGSSVDELKAADERFDFVEVNWREVLAFEGEPFSSSAESVQFGPLGWRYPLTTTSHGDYFLRSADQSGFPGFQGDEPYAELLVRKSDGMVEPAFTVAQLSQLGITSMPQNRNLYTGTPAGRIFAANDLIYFVAGTEEFGRELWQSDGTLEGTKMVRDIFPGQRSSGAELLGVSGDTLFFMANDGVHGQELWSVTVDEVFSEELAGDLDKNGEVNFADFLAFSQDFGRTSESDEILPSDFDGNGTVDFADFLVLSNNYGHSIS